MVSMVRRNAAVNADGFGMGWYNDGVSDDPIIFTSIAPAEHNINLSRIAGKTKSRVIFGHARAASPGSPIHDMNCHPFQFGRYCFMHNGGIANFRVLKRPLQNMLSQSSFNMIAGTTDSELAGALFVDQLPDRNPFVSHPSHVLTAALRRTIHLIHDAAQSCGDPQNPASMISSLNFAVTDGHTTVCSRFRDSTVEDPPSLYYCQYTSHQRVEGETEFYFDPEKPVVGVMVGSEPLTYNSSIWRPIPKNHLITILPDNTFTLDPVFDEHYIARKAIAKWKAFVQRRKASNHSNGSVPDPFLAVPPLPDMTRLLFSNHAGGSEGLSIQSLLASASPNQLKTFVSQLASSSSAPLPSSSDEVRGQMID
jgi:glutamine amidotransferase